MTMERPQLPETTDAGLDADAELDAQAANWLVRRQRGLSARDEADWQAWLARDPAHRRAYGQVAEIWQALDHIPQQDLARYRAEIAASRARGAPASPGRRAFMPRFALAGTAFAAVGAGVVGWQYWQSTPTFSAVFTTRRGELQTVSLPDGSKIELDTDTHVEARLFRHRREVRLVRGQAMFAVQSDPACPFNVLAQSVTVTVVGTRFSVRCTETGLEHGTVRVEVEEGRVRVAAAPQPDAAPHSVELAAGEAMTTGADGLPGQIEPIAPTAVAVWRQGRVAFNNTTLLRALQEFARYGATNVVVDDPVVAQMRLTGSFDVHQLDRFAHALPRVLPVRLRQRGNLVEVVRAA